MTRPRVAIVLESDADFEAARDLILVLEEFEVPYECTLSSAYLSPDKTHRYAAMLEERGLEVVIACGRFSAGLAGAVAAHTILPVIAVILEPRPESGLPCMPAGVPVALAGSGRHSTRNAGIMAVQILARSDSEMAARLRDQKKRLADEIEAADRELRKGRHV